MGNTRVIYVFNKIRQWTGTPAPTWERQLLSAGPSETGALRQGQTSRRWRGATQGPPELQTPSQPGHNPRSVSGSTWWDILGARLDKEGHQWGTLATSILTLWYMASPWATEASGWKEITKDMKSPGRRSASPVVMGGLQGEGNCSGSLILRARTKLEGA